MLHSAAAAAWPDNRGSRIHAQPRRAGNPSSGVLLACRRARHGPWSTVQHPTRCRHGCRRAGATLVPNSGQAGQGWPSTLTVGHVRARRNGP